MQPLRSALYVPADKPRAITRAAALSCDAVILDLEDAVAAEAKADARDRIAQAVVALRPKTVVVRVNALGTPGAAADLAAARRAGADAVLFPKVSGARAAADLVFAAAPLPSWAMIETPSAVIEAAAIARAGMRALVAGWNDLALSCGMAVSSDRRELWAAIGTVVLAARARGAIALDGVPLSLRDADATCAEARQARAFGFDGKTLVHPDQIEPCHTGFAASADERAAAVALLAAWEARPPGTGVIAHGGRLVEALHAEAARRLLAREG